MKKSKLLLILCAAMPSFLCLWCESVGACMTIEIFVTIIGILLFVALTAERDHLSRDNESDSKAKIIEICRDAAIVHLISMAVALIFVTIK